MEKIMMIYKIDIFTWFAIDNHSDWPVRFLLSSFYHTYGVLGIPDDKSTCDLCTIACDTCKESVTYLKKAHNPTACGYTGTDYTRTHCDMLWSMPCVNGLVYHQ